MKPSGYKVCISMKRWLTLPRYKPIPYRQAPIPLTEARHRQQQEEENHKKLNAGKEAMKQIMAGVNSKFKRKEE